MKRYWATWRDLKDKYLADGLSNAQADAMRDELCLSVHHLTMSSKDMTMDQLGDMIKEFTTLLDPDNLTNRLKDTGEDARKRRQYIYSITKEQPHPNYAAGISQDIYKRRDWRNLPTKDLLTLRRKIGNDRRGKPPTRLGGANAP